MARPLAKTTVASWFQKLAPEEQRNLVAEFSGHIEKQRGKEIAELEKRLASLRNGYRPQQAVANVAKRNSRVKGQKLPPKYGDKAGNTWTGRGLQPRWLRDALRKGGKLESFLLSPAKR